MSDFKTFENFVNEKMTHHQIIEDIFFIWDDYFNYRLGITGGNSGNNTFTFDFEDNISSGMFADFRAEVEALLKSNKVKYDWCDGDQLIIKK